MLLTFLMPQLSHLSIAVTTFSTDIIRTDDIETTESIRSDDVQHEYCVVL